MVLKEEKISFVPNKVKLLLDKSSDSRYWAWATELKIFSIALSVKLFYERFNWTNLNSLEKILRKISNDCKSYPRSLPVKFILTKDLQLDNP